MHLFIAKKLQSRVVFKLPTSFCLVRTRVSGLAVSCRVCHHFCCDNG